MTELARDSVVEIRTILASGTGWIYRVDGNGKAWILTNEHVIRGARTVTVRLSGSGGTRTGTILGQDGIRDLAVLTICCNRSWEALPTVSATALRAGSDVVALGFPSFRVGTELSVTTGVVSSYGFHDESRSWIIQTDAALNPGNSGGPLLNGQGQVIGVVSARVDPARGENIGFAISMRTVELELDYLERGRTVLASPTPRPTRIPTPVPSLGISGTLMHDPSGGFIGCSNNRYSSTVISDGTIDSAAFARFLVPDVREWSIGFVYHDPLDTDGASDTVTYIASYGPNSVYAGHWVRSNGEYVHQPPSERIQPSILRTSRGGWNELSFRTTSDGSFLRLNDETVIEVPASQLIRRFGWSELCIGFLIAEGNPYSVRYKDLRTHFAREGVSGSVSHPVPDDLRVECPTYTSDTAYIKRNATDSWFVLDFTVPYVEKWSFGIIHHGVGERNSRTYISSSGVLNFARHQTYEDGEFFDGPQEFIPSFRLTAGEKVRLEFETTDLGNSMYLDGSKILDVPSNDLTRRHGSTRLCTGLINGETEPYTIRFTNLWAWAD